MVLSMNYSKLRGKIREVFGSQKNFAEAIGINTVTISSRLCGKTEWKAAEIIKACDLLGIDASEISTYFFLASVFKE